MSPRDDLTAALAVYDDKRAEADQFPLGDRLGLHLATAALTDAVRALLAEDGDPPERPAHTCRTGVIGSAYGCDACGLRPEPSVGDAAAKIEGVLRLTADALRLRDAILDIDAHATPFGSDNDGYVTGGYLISVGSLHRALGVVGHTAPKCRTCEASTHDCAAPPSGVGEHGGPIDG